MSLSNTESTDLPTCQICTGPTHLIYRGHPGYKEPDVYDIGHCETCDTSFAVPLAENVEIYELIYANPEIVPGYKRYAQYAANIRAAKDALAFLAGAEDVYWAIEVWLRSSSLTTQNKILEVGSGLGYLTYAISQRGYDITGLDISAKAVRTARNRFGERFVRGDLNDYSASHEHLYDAVIATELIEHVADVVRLFDAMVAVVKRRGSIVITTPNKTPYPKRALWETEPPPVHLWWFSENSLRALAARRNYSVEFIDFNEFNRRHYRRLPATRNAHYSVTRTTRLHANGVPVLNRHPVRDAAKHLAHKIHAIEAARKMHWHMDRRNTELMKRREIMCAIFTTHS